MKSIKFLACIFASLLLATSVAHAQGVGASGDIIGTLTDPTGGVMPKVTIVVVGTETGLQRTTFTDDTGQYRVTGLSPATYDVRAELSGFQTEIRKGVNVTVGQTVIVDFQLKVAQLASEVEVTGEVPLVETERAHQAETIEEKFIRDLPINRRDYLSYTLLAPGVSDSTRVASDVDFRVKQTPQSGLSFYGSNGRGNNLTVDGGEANGDTGGVRLTLSQDAVQEFQINRSNYSAELGGGSGASINIVSKSGSNILHGSVYGFFRNDVFDAANPFSFSQALKPGDTFNPANPDSTGVPVKDALSRQQFGGTVGFPIKQDKTFLFLAFEGLRQDAQTAVPLLTSTNIFRPQSDPLNNQVAILNGLTAAGATPVTCFTGKPQIAASACAAALTSALTVSPTTGLSPGQSALNAFLNDQFERNGGLFPFNTRQYQASGRFDHQFSNKNQLFFRYNYSHDLEENPDVQSLTGFSRGSSVHQYDNTIQGAWFHQFSPNTSNEARAQWNYNSFNVVPNVLGQVGLNIPGFGDFGNQIFLPSLTILRRPEFADNLTLVRGRHTMKLGGTGLIRGNHTESHTFFPGRFVFGAASGGALSPCLAAPASCGLTGPGGSPLSPAALDSLQAVSLGAPQLFQQGFEGAILNYPRPFMGAYWQDSWAIRPNFTFNFGLRYELDGQYGALKTDKNNFAPRVSFAWDPFKDHKTVVRGGFGIFYGTIDRQITDVVNYLGVVDPSQHTVTDLSNSNCTSSPNACFRQVALVFASGANPLASGAGNIFRTLFTQGKIARCALGPGQDACITKADLTQFPGIIISHTGAIPTLTFLFFGQPGYQNPYSEQGEFGIEREIAGGLSISASYIYVHTLKIPVAIDTNNFQILKLPCALGLQDPSCQQSAPAGPAGIRIRQWGAGNPNCVAPTGSAANCFVNPALLQTDQYSSAGSSLYQGGILEIKKRFSNHFTVLANYTFSKAIDTTTDFNSDYGPNDQTCLSCERGLSSFDQRHKVVVATVLDSPWKNRALSGFELAPIVRYNSAHPFNLLAGSNVNNDRHSTTDRPPGAGRNTGIGPNYMDFDMRLSRQFKLTEKASVQFIAEGFNLFNRTNFGSVNNTVGVIAADPALGFNLSGRRDRSPSQPLGFTSALPMRQLQFGVRLSY